MFLPRTLIVFLAWVVSASACTASSSPSDVMLDYRDMVKSGTSYQDLADKIYSSEALEEHEYLIKSRLEAHWNKSTPDEIRKEWMESLQTELQCEQIVLREEKIVSEKAILLYDIEHTCENADHRIKFLEIELVNEAGDWKLRQGNRRREIN